MSPVSEVNDAVQQKSSRELSAKQSLLSKSDWEAATSRAVVKGSGEPTSGQLSFDNDIYGKAIPGVETAKAAGSKVNDSVPTKSASADDAKANSDSAATSGSKDNLTALNKSIAKDIAI